ncbi:YoaK family protein [Tsukamurella sp. 8J]|uniref:YoaK family protein n=1 Tax=Tsukamurella sp. 8J TaxID=3031962 RepID=UPI0023BA0C3A|nr:YoaK family protein [Tsukamurella sp. 8J]MDF0530435.1 YoaK family protein [Tsukamurella sp. 8J]
MVAIRRRELALATVLASTSGFLDAVGYISLGGYFVSFISGNSTTMAAEAAGGMWPGAGRALGLIGLFFVGVIAGSVLSRMGDGRTSVLWAAVCVVTVSAFAHSVGGGVPAVLLVAVAMGVLNSTFQRDGEVSVGLTYMTGTLVKAGQRLVDAFWGGPRWVWARHALLWVALTAGALAGAFAYSQWHLASLWIADGFLFAAAAVTGMVRGRGGRRSDRAGVRP